MIAIRENERRARFLGIPVEFHIWVAFSLSCFFMAFAGALYALLNNFADPRVLHYSLSGDFVIMAVMGGMRTFWGPLLGAIVFVVLQDYISSVTVNWMSFIGMLIVLVVLFFPRGLLGCGAADGMSTLEVKNFTKRFGSLVAVRDVSMTGAKGELRAVIGPNGAGKTTFFNLVSGFFAPTSGSILFDGRDVTALPPTSGSDWAWRAPSRSRRSFPSSPCSRTSASPPRSLPATVCAPWLSRADTAALRVGSRRRSRWPGLPARPTACRRVRARRPARRRDRDGARAQAASPSAR